MAQYSVAANLRNLIALYEGRFRPLTEMVKIVCAQDGTRQVANEVRNCHTHLYWGCYRNGCNRADEIRRASDHLLRAVVDEYKMVTDALVGLVPPSAPLPALVARTQAERLLLKVWHAPAREHLKRKKFSDWDQALGLALQAVQVSHEAIPPALLDQHRLMRNPGIPKAELAKLVAALPVVIADLAPLLDAENRFRVVLRIRPDEHAQQSLCLFDLFMEALRHRRGARNAYRGHIRRLVRSYREELFDCERETAITLVERGEGVMGVPWERHWIEKLMPSSQTPQDLDASSALTDTLLSSIPLDLEVGDISRLHWRMSSQPLDYQGFADILHGSFVMAPLTDEAVQTLYTVYRLEWPRSPSGVLRRLMSDFRHRLEALNPSWPETRQTQALTRFCRRQAQIVFRDHIVPDLRSHLGKHLYAVWFFDMVGSSVDPASARHKQQLFERAMVILTRVRNTAAADSGAAPVFTNTWGDAMIAVFTNVVAAVAVAQEIRDYAGPAQIHLRFGMAWGQIEIGVNPFLGIDVTGYPVDLAARLEAIAESGELLADTSVGEALAQVPGYVVTSTTRPLAKDVGEWKQGDPIPCCRIDFAR